MIMCASLPACAGADQVVSVVQDQVDSLLLPVVKSYEERQTQLRMDAFVTMTHRFSKIRSKRLQAAVSAVAGAPLSEELTLAADEAAKQDAAKEASKGKRKPAKRSRSGTNEESDEDSALPAHEVAAAAEQRRSKRAKKTKINNENDNGSGTPVHGGEDDGDDIIFGGDYADKSMSRFLY